MCVLFVCCVFLVVFVMLFVCLNYIDMLDDLVSVLVNVQVVWVEIGDVNQVIVCVIMNYMFVLVSDLLCLQLIVDGKLLCMMLCVVVVIVVQWMIVSDLVDLKLLSFLVFVCEVMLLVGVQVVSVVGCMLLLLKVQLQCIVIIVDMGCWMKKVDNVWQVCNDVVVWLFDIIVVSVVKLLLDFVLYVGDYYYCENVCLLDIVGCKDSLWGYGWDMWQVDLFCLVVLLFVKVLWVVVCGNYEECVWVGQGWFCFFDLCLYLVVCLCDDLVNDNNVNYLEFYVVLFGGGLQVIVFDIVKVGCMLFKMIDVQFGIYQK